MRDVGNLLKLLAVVALSLPGGDPMAGWPDETIDYRGGPDLLAWEVFRARTLESPFIVIRNEAGARLEVLETGDGFSVWAKIAEYVDLEGFSRNSTSEELRRGWVDAGRGKPLKPVGAPLLEVFACADSEELGTSRFSFLAAGADEGTVYKCLNLLEVECGDLEGVAKFAMAYFRSAEDNKLAINWYRRRSDLVGGGSQWLHREPAR